MFQTTTKLHFASKSATLSGGWPSPEHGMALQLRDRYEIFSKARKKTWERTLLEFPPPSKHFKHGGFYALDIRTL